jgi:hypothetical protein
VARAKRELKNVIVRPRSDNIIVQLDDVDAEKVELLKPFSFLVYETSLGNNQAWVALANDVDEDFPRRLRKGVGADPGASGATRLAGSRNYKPNRAPAYPTIKIIHLYDGNFASAAALEHASLVAPPEPPIPFSPRPTHATAWPDYARG